MNKPTTIITADFDDVYEKVFLNVSIPDFLNRGMDLLCSVIPYDFFGAQTIYSLAKLYDTNGRVFIWLCRSSGYNLCSEREAFIKDTGSYKTLVACATPFVSAYALLVEITGELEGKPIGNIYKLNLAEYVREIQSKVVWQKEHKCTYKDGYTLTLPLGTSVSWLRDHGTIVSDDPIPESETALLRVLKNHTNRRSDCVAKALMEGKQHE